MSDDTLHFNFNTAGRHEVRRPELPSFDPPCVNRQRTGSHAARGNVPLCIVARNASRGKDPRDIGPRPIQIVGMCSQRV